MLSEGQRHSEVGNCTVGAHRYVECVSDTATPELDKASFNCPRCGSFAAQTWHQLIYRVKTNIFQARDITETGDSIEGADSPYNQSFLSQWYMSQCASCSHMSVWRSDRLIYPATSNLPLPSPDMPVEVVELYEEAREVYGVSPRAGAAMARATLEKLLKSLDPDAPKGTRLDGYIARVESKVSQPTWQLLTVIRHTGNKSLHIDDEPDDAVVFVLSDADAQVAPLMFEAINDVVQQLISHPKRVAELYARVPENVRTDAERKAAQAAE